MTPDRAAIGVYRAALYLYPPAFRRDFGPDMLLDFDEASREGWSTGGWEAIVALWCRVGFDLAMTVVVEWLRDGHAAIVVLSAVVSAVIFEASFSTIVRALARFTVFAPSRPTDRDVLLLLLLVMSVLLIVAAALLFSLWFTRLGHRCRRRF